MMRKLSNFDESSQTKKESFPQQRKSSKSTKQRTYAQQNNHRSEGNSYINTYVINHNIDQQFVDGSLSGRSSNLNRSQKGQCKQCSSYKGMIKRAISSIENTLNSSLQDENLDQFEQFQTSFQKLLEKTKCLQREMQSINLSQYKEVNISTIKTIIIQGEEIKALKKQNYKLKEITKELKSQVERFGQITHNYNKALVGCFQKIDNEDMSEKIDFITKQIHYNTLPSVNHQEEQHETIISKRTQPNTKLLVSNQNTTQSKNANKIQYEQIQDILNKEERENIKGIQINHLNI